MAEYNKVTILFEKLGTQDQELLMKLNMARDKISMSTAIKNLLLYIVPNYSNTDLHDMMAYEKLPIEEEQVDT